MAYSRDAITRDKQDTRERETILERDKRETREIWSYGGWPNIV